jgi:hypothetical protein
MSAANEHQNGGGEGQGQGQEEQEETQTVSFGDQKTSVFCWAVGRLTQEGRVSCVLFGQFTKDVAPPPDLWIFIGRNIAQDIKDADVEEGHEGSAAKSTITSSENDLYEASMDCCRADKLCVETMKTQAAVSRGTGTGKERDAPPGSPARAASPTRAAKDAAASAPILRVGGCSLGGVNGRYIEAGYAEGVMRFRNVKGWVIFRQALEEIPELGIYADSCYDAFKGPSTRDLLDRRAEFAATDLLRHKAEGGPLEGTAGFKRRFLEVSRAGSRMVMAAQQTALIRDQQTKAALRTQADIEMLKIIGDIEAGARVKLKPLSRSLSSINAPGNIDDNIDFKLSKSRNIQNQTLSLSMLPEDMGSSKKKRKGGKGGHSRGRVGREAELSLQVTKAIARRELELGRLSLEATDLNRTYIGMEDSHGAGASQGQSRGQGKELIALGLENLFSQMAGVRAATIDVSEALGAWSRYVMLERRQHAAQAASDAAMGMSADPRAGRAYCVAIAVRGAPLYPKSKPLHSSNSRACRGEEPEKLALDIKYGGIFESKVDAVEAYRAACIEVPIEHRVMPYVDAPPMYIGLRVCGRHYLVRSDFVPSTLPCEQCIARTNAQPKLLVPSMAATLGVDVGGSGGGGAGEESHNKVTLPQFVWHGVNYVDKMWNDLDFVSGVSALKRYTCGIDPHMNPLLLSGEEVRDFYGTLNKIHATTSRAQGGSGADLQILQRLKGRVEQLEDAVEASAWNKDRRTGSEHMGVAYRFENVVPDLSRIQDYLPALGSGPLPAPPTTLHPAGAGGSKAGGTKLQMLEDISTLSGPLAPEDTQAQDPDTTATGSNSNSNNTRQPTVRFSTSPDAGEGGSPPSSAQSIQHAPSSPFGKGLALSAGELRRSAQAATAEAASLGRSLSRKHLALDAGMTAGPFGSTAMGFSGDGMFDQSAAPAADKGVVIGPERGRAMRALSILSQSEVADPFQFEEDVLSHITAVQKKVLASSGAHGGKKPQPLMSKTAPAGGAGGGKPRQHGQTQGQGQGQPEGGEAQYPAQYTVKASYGHHGANFETVQTRNAVANRTSTTWCRSDVGEWAGLSTKGPNMKAWEHRDRALANARLAAEKRKEMQHMIRVAISFDFVACDVPWITELISRATSQGMKGSVIGLDILQAELYLKNRIRAIAACKSLQRWRRALVERRRVRAMRAMIRRARLHRACTESEAGALARRLVPETLAAVAASLGARHSASLVCFTINLRGVSVIANVHATARNAKKSRRLCASCRLEPGSATQRFDAALHGLVRDRVPCTCRYLTQPERWLVKIYEPLSCYHFQRMFSIAEVRSLIRSTHAASSITPQQHLQKVVTPSAIASLDDIKTQLELGPLYRLLMRPSGGGGGVDAAVAWLHAQKEGAALCLQMPTLSAALLREVADPEAAPNMADFFVHNNKYETILKTRQICDVGESGESGGHIDRAVNRHSKTVSVVGSFASARHFLLTEHLKEKHIFINEFLPASAGRSVDIDSFSGEGGGGDRGGFDGDTYSGRHGDVFDYDAATIGSRRALDDNCSPQAASGQLKAFGFSGLAGRVVMVRDTDADLSPSANKPASTWEPLQDILSARHYLRRLQWSRPGLESGSRQATAAWEAARDAAEDHRFCSLERLLMEMEDSRARVHRCDLDIKQAEDRVAAVMAFSKRKLAKFEAETNNEEEDWREAWEGNEDGTAWIGLNEARKTRRRLKLVYEELAERSVAVYDARAELARLYGVQGAARAWDDTLLGHLAELGAREAGVRATSALLEDLAREALTAFMSRLSMSRSCGVPSSHYRISVPTLDLSYIRDPLLRNHRGMRSAWNLVGRQVRRMTGFDRKNERYPDVAIGVEGPDYLAPARNDPNHFAYGRRFSQGTAVRFRAISVSKDPVTGLTIIDTGMEVRKQGGEPGGGEGGDGSELSVFVYPEESAYEADGYILVGDMRATVESCFPTDIVLSEDEVKTLCKRFGRGTGAAGAGGQKAGGDQSKGKGKEMDSKYDFAGAVNARRDKKMGVVVFPRRRHHLDALPPTYHQRRLKRERQEQSDAARLLSVMRLSPHSGRICVGTLHLLRRAQSLEQTLKASLWYKDWLESECPSTWTNEQAHYLHMFGGRFCLVSVRDAFGSAEVRLSFYGMDPVCVTVSVPLQDMVESMLEKPFLLATFVCDLIVNRFSADIVDHLVSCLDLELPGENRSQRRADLFGETPTLMFCAKKKDRYRPVFRTHRLLCGAYFCVQVLTSAADDLLVLLQAPIDGQFWCHAYRGEDIPVELTIAELRAIVLTHVRAGQRADGKRDKGRPRKKGSGGGSVGTGTGTDTDTDSMAEAIAAAVRPGLHRHMSLLHAAHMDLLLDFLLARLAVDRAIIRDSTRMLGGADGGKQADTQVGAGAAKEQSDDDSDSDSDEGEEEVGEGKSEFAASSVLSAQGPPADGSANNSGGGGGGGGQDKGSGSGMVATLGSSILRYKDSAEEEDSLAGRRAVSATGPGSAPRKRREQVVDAAGYISWASEEEDTGSDEDSVFEENFRRSRRGRGKKVPMRVPGGRRITEKIIKNVLATARLYNHWAGRRKADLPELHLKSHADVFRRFFAEYTVLNDTGVKDHFSSMRAPLPWKLIDATAQDPAEAAAAEGAAGGAAEAAATGGEGDRIRVHEELWTTLDPLRYAPPALPKSGAMGEEGAAGTLCGPVSDYVPPGVGTSTYWSLSVSTSGDRLSLHLLASPVDLGAGRAQVAVAKRELAEMGCEERLRRRADVAVEAVLREQSRAAVLVAVGRTLAPLAERLSLRREEAGRHAGLLRDGLSDVLPALDAHLVKRALSVFKLGRDRLAVDGDGAAIVQYERQAPAPAAPGIFDLSRSLPLLPGEGEEGAGGGEEGARLGAVSAALGGRFPIRVLRALSPAVLRLLLWLRAVTTALDSVDLHGLLHGSGPGGGGGARGEGGGIRVLYQTAARKALARPGAVGRDAHLTLLAAETERQRKRPFPFPAPAPAASLECRASGYCPAHKKTHLASSFRNPATWRAAREAGGGQYEWEAGALAVRDPSFLARALRGVKPRRILDSMRRLVCVSEPSIALFDVCSFFLHEPGRMRSAVALMDAPLLPPLSVGEDRDSSSSNRDSSADSGGALPPLAVHLARHAARRIVWRSVVHGVASACVAQLCAGMQRDISRAEAELGAGLLATTLEVDRDLARRQKIDPHAAERLPEAEARALRAAYVAGDHAHASSAPAPIPAPAICATPAPETDTDTDTGADADSSTQAVVTRRPPPPNRRIRCMGVFMPFDEDAAPVPFEVDGEEWLPAVRAFLFPALGAGLSGDAARAARERAGVERVSADTALVFIHKGFQGVTGGAAAAAINARFNLRLSRWLLETSMRRRLQQQRERQEQGLEEEGGGEDPMMDFVVPEVYGDAVVMLRQRPYADTVSALGLWSERRLVELNALREKRQRTATSRLYKRFNNFMQYRDLVFYWAARFEPAFKQLFGVVGTQRNGARASERSYPELEGENVTVDYFRCLLANVVHHIRRHGGRHLAGGGRGGRLARVEVGGQFDVGFETLDQAFLVDADIASGDRLRGYSFGHIPTGAEAGAGAGARYAITRQEIEETNIKVTTDKYRRFESFNHRRYMSGEQFLCFHTAPLTAAYELQARASQILYCLLRKHCIECRAPPSFCNVPGCAGVKTAIWESHQEQGQEQGPGGPGPEDGASLGGGGEGSAASVTGQGSTCTVGTGVKSLADNGRQVGSGYHVADIAVRDFMLNGLPAALLSKVFAAPRMRDQGLGPVEWGGAGEDGRAAAAAESSEASLRRMNSVSRVAPGSTRAWRGESTHFIMRRSGHQFRSLYRYLFPPQLSQSVSQEDYICMRRSALHRFFHETDDAVIKRLCHRAHVLQNEQIRVDNLAQRVASDTSRDIALKLPCAVAAALYAAFHAGSKPAAGWDAICGDARLPLPHYAPMDERDSFDPYPDEAKRAALSGGGARKRHGGVGGADDGERMDLGLIAKRAALREAHAHAQAAPSNAAAAACEEEGGEPAAEQPMSAKTFQWLCSRLVVTRRGQVFGHRPDTHYRHGQAVLSSGGGGGGGEEDRLGGGSASLCAGPSASLLQGASVERQQSEGRAGLLRIDAAPATLKFDRMFSQKSFFLRAAGGRAVSARTLRAMGADSEAEAAAATHTLEQLGGTFVRIHILCGVLHGYPSFSIPEAGCPPAASRYLHSAVLADLRHGLTVLVYDYASEAARALLIQGGLLLRLADALRGRPADLADLAARLHARAEQLLVLSRIGTTCTGIDLDPSALAAVHSDSGADTATATGADLPFPPPALPAVAPFSTRVRANGRSQFAVDTRGASLDAALALLGLDAG